MRRKTRLSGHRGEISLMTADSDRRSSVDGRCEDGAALASSVYDHYSVALQRYLLRRLRGPQEVRDLEQEVYLRLLRVQDAELVRNPQAYMYRIASHVVHEFRQRAREESVTFDSASAEEHEAHEPRIAADRLAEELHAERQVSRILKKLPARWRAMFILHVRDGLTHAEVAERLNISVHTVKKQMFRAFAALRGETGR
jgi:RNA polymerase sigma factor (sigma-70 family)